MLKTQKVILPALACVSLSQSGCASHLISSEQPDGVCAAGECDRSQTSIFGRAGISSNAATGAVPEECGANGFSRVEVQRSFAQGLATVLTLGAVNPATIKFACMKQPQNSQIECNFIPGTADPGTLDYIECVRRSTNEEPEAVRFTCKALPDTSDPAKIGEFTCTPDGSAWLQLLPMLERARAAKG